MGMMCIDRDNVDRWGMMIVAYWLVRRNDAQRKDPFSPACKRMTDTCGLPTTCNLPRLLLLWKYIHIV